MSVAAWVLVLGPPLAAANRSFEEVLINDELPDESSDEPEEEAVSWFCSSNNEELEAADG